jgi:hypothetical protein
LYNPSYPGARLAITVVIWLLDGPLDLAAQAERINWRRQ